MLFRSYDLCVIFLFLYVRHKPIGILKADDGRYIFVGEVIK